MAKKRRRHKKRNTPKEIVIFTHSATKNATKKDERGFERMKYGIVGPY